MSDHNSTGQSPPENLAPGTAEVGGDQATLLEYQLSEKIQNRVWAALKKDTRIFVIAFVILAGICTFVGFPMLLDMVSSRVKESLDKENQALRERIAQQLADMTLKTAELRAQADMAEKQLGSLKEFAEKYEALKNQVDASSKSIDSLGRESNQRIEQQTARLKVMSSRFEELSKQTEQLAKATASAQEAAWNAQLINRSLGEGVIATRTGGPAILQVEPSFPTDWGSLKGTGFGTGRGLVLVRVSLGGSRKARLSTVFLTGLDAETSEAIPLDSASVSGWEDRVIGYKFSADLKAQIKDAESVLLRKAEKKELDIYSTQYEFQVVTESSQKSNWYAIQGNEFRFVGVVPTLPDLKDHRLQLKKE